MQGSKHSMLTLLLQAVAGHLPILACSHTASQPAGAKRGVLNLPGGVEDVDLLHRSIPLTMLAWHLQEP